MDAPRVTARGVLLAAVALSAMTGGIPTLVGDGMALPEPKPRHYRTHLSKSERRGRTYAELQAMRAERMP
jgi:hypothetical protein